MRSMTNDYQSGATNGRPVSLAQERLWVLEQFTPGYPVYNLSAAWRLTGALNESALHQSLTEILRRHESLRTTFSEDGGQPKASVSAALPFDLPLIDLHDLPAEWREKEIGRLAGEQAGQSVRTMAFELLGHDALLDPLLDGTRRIEAIEARTAAAMAHARQHE